MPHMIRLREIIAAGTLGEVRTVIVDHNQTLSQDPAHRLQDPALGGGALLDLGIYPVSFAWDVFGAPTTIHGDLVADGDRRRPPDRDALRLRRRSAGGHAHARPTPRARTRRPSSARRRGSQIDPVWYTPTTMRVIDPDDNVIEEFDGRSEGRGMQFQAAELERIVASGALEDDILPPSQSVAIMESLDEIRSQIGLVYPSEK